MNVLCTGGAGFIGSHLCERLVNLNHRVVAIDNLLTGKVENIQHLIHLPNFQFVYEDILNNQVLDRLTSEADIVIHLAAVVGVKLIVEDPVRTIHTNVMGTDTVLTTANRYGCKVLIASTSEVYGKGVKIPFYEDDDSLLGPTNRSRWSYAASKAVDEFLGLAYYSQFSLPVVIMRFFNTIGPRQTGRYGMVVPRFIQQAIQGLPIEVYGDGLQSRCFGYVSDTVDAIIKLALHPDAVGKVFNIGSTEEVTILELAKQIVQLSNSNSEIKFIPYEQVYVPGFEDMRRRVPSTDRIKQLVGFEPKFTLKDSLLKIIEYEKGNKS